MSQLYMDLLPPERWQDLERLTHQVCRAEWDDPDVTTVGRPGQAQNGVDVLGVDRTRDRYTRVGVQCKRRRQSSPSGEVLAGGLLTEADVEAEVKAAAKFDPPLHRFSIATTARQDAPLQQSVSTLSELHEARGLFPVSIWFWEHLEDRINRHVELLYLFYSDVLRASGVYDRDRHILAAMRDGFDRPMMHTPFSRENSLTDFLDATSRLQQLLTTGKLKDRDGALVASVPSAKNLTSEQDQRIVRMFQRKLQVLREEFTVAVQRGAVRQSGTVVEVLDHHVEHRMNALRQEVLAELDGMLGRHGLEPLNSPLLTWAPWR